MRHSRIVVMRAKSKWLSLLTLPSQQGTTVPYFAAYQLPPNAAALTDETTKPFDGLQVAHAVHADDGERHLLTYWKSSDHFVVAGDSFCQSLHVSLLPGHGRVDKFVMQPKPWFERVKVSTVILSVAALFGAAEVIDNRYDRAFAVPALVIKPERSSIDVNEGGTIRSVFVLVNQLPGTPHRNVALSAFLVDQSGKRNPLTVTESGIPVLAGGLTKEVIVEGTVSSVGKYDLVVQATADAGRLSWAKQFVSKTVLVAWPRIPAGSFRKIEARDGWARFQGLIAVGPEAPNGLDCELEIQGVPSLRFEDQFEARVSDRALKWNVAGVGSSSVALLTWSLTPVKSQTTVPIELSLLSDSQANWDEVVKRARLKCDYRKEKLDAPKT
jgi:hypothetical protein